MAGRKKKKAPQKTNYAIWRVMAEKISLEIWGSSPSQNESAAQALCQSTWTFIWGLLYIQYENHSFAAKPKALREIHFLSAGNTFWWMRQLCCYGWFFCVCALSCVCAQFNAYHLALSRRGFLIWKKWSTPLTHTHANGSVKASVSWWIAQDATAKPNDVLYIWDGCLSSFFELMRIFFESVKIFSRIYINVMAFLQCCTFSDPGVHFAKRDAFVWKWERFGWSSSFLRCAWGFRFGFSFKV